MDITVVGAGVIGLTAAVTLEERGHHVRVVAAASGAATTSAVAAAVWFPYRVGPRDRVIEWAVRTRRWLEQIAREAPEAGVDLLTCYELAGPARPWWVEALDAELVAAPVGGEAWRFTAPRADPALFMAYLASMLRRPIEQRVVTELTAEPGDVVINCTGLGARELARDDQLTALFGQIVLAELDGSDRGIAIGDERDPDAMFYAIPRRGELVLGGCALPYPPGAEPTLDTAITARIVAHAHRLGFSIGALRGERAGLRPYRAEVRLERDGRVIHDYGHGGAGFTLCRGCAEEVAALVT